MSPKLSTAKKKTLNTEQPVEPELKVHEAETAAKETKRPTRKAKAAKPEKKISALDAAARVLAESGQPMTTGELIDEMAAKGYWSSPNGLTPSATLYSALAREITKKQNDSRFQKVERGKFALAGKG
jgi:HB1, ASXL, restriction endonuclease HTH domain